jgi:threonine 3-dehydrogenase
MKSETMKALIKPSYGPGVELARVPVPPVGPFDVLIRVKAAGICGSDVPIFDWDDPWTIATVKKGQIIGHEFCGEVVEKGEQAGDIRIGDFVVAEGHLNCGICMRCRSGEAHVCPNTRLVGFDYPGAFAEYVSLPGKNVMSVSDLSTELATILDPLGCGVHSVTTIPHLGNAVLVTGCGPIGLITIMLAKISGAYPIIATEVSPYRLAMAAKAGADLAVNPNKQDATAIIKEATMESAVDVFFEMSGDPGALRLGFSVLRGGGHAVLMGLPKKPVKFDFGNEIVAKGITVHGIIGRTHFGNWIQVQRILDSQRHKKSADFTSIITHHFLIDEFEKAIALVHARECGKIILHMNKETIIRDK